MENRTVLQARVDGVNKAHRIANEIGPKLVEALKPFVGSKVIKSTNGQLVAKAKAAVDAVLLPYKTAPLPPLIYLGTSHYFLAFWVKTCEGAGQHFHYYETMIYVGDLSNGVLENLKEYDPKHTDYSVASVEASRAQYKVAKKALQEAESDLHPFGEYDR